MPDLVAVRGVDPWRRRLFLPTYKVTDVARYVGQSPQAIANWFYRETLSGVVLPGKEPLKPLSYMQLVEVAVVSIFRKLGVRLQSVRSARQYLAQRFDSEFPFAQYRFKTEGFHVLLDLGRFERDEDLRLIVADKGGQLAWEEIMENRLLEFDYESELALRWHLAGRKSLVVIDPRVSFGAPTVSGIPTWILRGRWHAGETINDIMEDLGIDDVAVRDGLLFEGITATV